MKKLIKAKTKLQDYFGVEPSQPDGNWTFFTHKLSVEDEIEIGNICCECDVDFALGTSHVTIFKK